MSTLLCAETNAVVKLDLGDKGGIRRITFSRLWDPETSKALFGRLSFLAFRHSTLNRPGIHRAIITYTDVDGDTITISTHRELTEAFEQFVTHPSYTDVTPIVLRAQVSFVKKQKGANNKARLNKIRAARVMKGTGILAGDDLGSGNELSIDLTATDAEKINGAANAGAGRASNRQLRKKRNVEEKEEAERKKQKEEEVKGGATPSEAKRTRGKGEGDYGSDGTGEDVEEDTEADCGIEGEVSCDAE